MPEGLCYVTDNSKLVIMFKSSKQKTVTNQYLKLLKNKNYINYVIRPERRKMQG